VPRWEKNELNFVKDKSLVNFVEGISNAQEKT
jgi:hypothetical protein